MKITSELFKRKIFILFILVITVVLVIDIANITVGTWGINKTVGWAYDLTMPNLMITWIISLLFTLTYLTFLLFKKKTNRILSVVNITSFGFTLLAYRFLDEEKIFILNCFSIIIFLVNVSLTLINKKNTKPAHNSDRT